VLYLIIQVVIHSDRTGWLGKGGRGSDDGIALRQSSHSDKLKQKNKKGNVKEDYVNFALSNEKTIFHLMWLCRCV